MKRLRIRRFFPVVLILVGLFFAIGLIFGGWFSAGKYNNREYRFSLSYPENLDLEEYQPSFISIGSREGEVFDSDVDVQVVKSSDPSSAGDFSEFAYEQARLACAADGVAVSIKCTDVQLEQPFETASGLSGTVFYLKQVTTDNETKEETISGKGPFFVFDISGSEDGNEFTALVVRVPMAKPQKGEDSALVRSIAHSVKVRPVKHR